jgi:hypothetical protein
MKCTVHRELPTCKTVITLSVPLLMSCLTPDASHKVVADCVKNGLHCFRCTASTCLIRGQAFTPSSLRDCQATDQIHAVPVFAYPL